MAGKSLKGTFLIISALLLTIVTQVGGVLLLIIWPLLGAIHKKLKVDRFPILFEFSGFILFYLAFTLLVLPVMASWFGRVPLPIFGSSQLKPLTSVTWLCNRHYVRPELRNVATNLAAEMQHQYPGSVLFYLDANLPSIDDFPLVPHLSHSDGKKLDLAFFYNDSSGNFIAGSPSLIGYGVSEDPAPDEPNQPVICEQSGFWQYSFMTTIIPQTKKEHYHFDPKRTKAMTLWLAKDAMVSKIFIEPHLQKRLGLNALKKVRYHGCQAVRHDDHLHVQIK